MIIIMKPSATKKQVTSVIDRIKDIGLDVQINQDKEQVVLGLLGDTRSVQDIAFRSYEGVDTTIRISNTYKLTSREFHPQDTVVDVDGVKIGDGSFITMAGPCSVEGLDQIRQTAQIAKAGGAKILRGGAFKPRTSPYAFQGLEEEGLKYLRQAADELDMKVITEVMDESHIDLVAQYSDILQIGARNMQNFKLLAAVGKTGKPIGLKRGISGTINEWLNAAEYVAVAGKSPVIFIERGIRTFEDATRNTFDLSAVPLIKKMSHFPIIVDPSHGTGVWDLVPPMARAGVAAGADGMIVEIHPAPENAWSDGQQSLNEDTYRKMMQEIEVLNAAMNEIHSLEMLTAGR
ncbi:MAG: 3-deoxy-7-phosphoheptulonate synthase [Tetragenococcus halophilus]|uniref:3-deoxy-D-arabino-heptulosonate 7-phosphate synthase n=3 Tax=Tetragenococcus halophilus TaxID=51669 RepID=A0A2H6E0T2_TETHA|nr:3-deoxy-7-phosphoheptulonate synthase [Tetragenococcus halophilus]MCF1674958.1 3-deoxy-7-phosphoheptulonate synthase [Tetragenococcus halophilus]MCO7025608.1 3-deoxy-7-phosphoheptulonate synthase [Tetragenococcus halophilus]MCO8284913.1 3-deoxy-7-phosphoheptulonate synthase [Tetragenococcus halophilus]MCO8285689.1 3-deoxy-7-phosphoheptulonate synthase [Tetragenococcus halophilus]MCO8287837.1 3-deoxy-7-phosphoheptulonate synthase [Tetragenococcus halophilus]